MANTFAPELVPDTIADSVLTVLSARLAPLSSFSTPGSRLSQRYINRERASAVPFATSNATSV